MVCRNELIDVFEVDVFFGLLLLCEWNWLIGYVDMEYVFLEVYWLECLYYVWIFGGLKGIGKVIFVFWFV